MNFVVSLVQILLAAVLHLSAVKTASISKGVEKSKNEVIPLTDVIRKSMCQPREVLVDISHEYPEDTEHTYVPSCVVLNRCGGCCNDEAMECVHTETHNVTLQNMASPECYLCCRLYHCCSCELTFCATILKLGG